MALSKIEKGQLATVIGEECKRAITVSETLLHAPKAACMIETLTILACCTKDPSLRSGAIDEKFLYLRTPDSFKASLYQVINSMKEAFRTGHTCVERIRLSLENLPDCMEDIMDALEEVK